LFIVQEVLAVRVCSLQLTAVRERRRLEAMSLRAAQTG
jgi:hypothetical protein